MEFDSLVILFVSPQVHVLAIHSEENYEFCFKIFFLAFMPPQPLNLNDSYKLVTHIFSTKDYHIHHQRSKFKM